MTGDPTTMDRATLVSALLCTRAVLSRVDRLALAGGVTVERRGPAWVIERDGHLLAEDGLWEPRELVDLDAPTLSRETVAHLERTAWTLPDALARCGFDYQAPGEAVVLPMPPVSRGVV
jgi:hypothetical protein